MNVHFDIAKIKRAIKTHGQSFIFSRYALDSYGEPTTNKTQTTVEGLFHQTRGYITKNVTDGTIARSAPQPQILTLFSETSASLAIKDEVTYCGQTYTVTGLNNIGNLNAVIDISLEMIDNGT